MSLCSVLSIKQSLSATHVYVLGDAEKRGGGDVRAFLCDGHMVTTVCSSAVSPMITSGPSVKFVSVIWEGSLKVGVRVYKLMITYEKGFSEYLKMKVQLRCLH